MSGISTNVAADFELPAPARCPSRIELLLNLISSSSSDSAQADDILTVMSQSGLLAQIPHDETQHKLTVRINSLISSQNPLGYRLAHLWIQQDPSVWNNHLVSDAATWATQIVNLVSAPEKLLTQREQSDRLLAAALQLAITHLFPEGIASKQEFYRQVVHPNMPKFAFGLIQLLESILAKQQEEGLGAYANHLHTILVFLNRLLHAHPAQFRPVSSRIHECITSLLYRDDFELVPLSIFNSAAAVLSSLHLTGSLASKGSEASGGLARTTQSQLWQATLLSQLHLASEAWRHATSSYLATDVSPLTGDAQDGGATYKHLQAYPKDPLAATNLAHQRLCLLLGSRGRCGLIKMHLRASTSRNVPIPAGKLIKLASDMLRLDLSSRFKPTAEAKVCSLQAAHLGAMHTRALALIAQLAITAPGTIPLQASRVLGDICRIAEAGISIAGKPLTSARLKLASLRTIAILVGRKGIALPLDPAGRITSRLARLSATQVAKAILQPAQQSTSDSGATAGDGRKPKKARLYESDTMFGNTIALKDRIHSLGVEELASTQAALEILVAVYPLLTTNLSPLHYDQLQVAIQTTLALVESLSDSISTYSTNIGNRSSGADAPTTADLLESAIEALAELCLDSTSSTLALVLPRAIPVLGRIANSPSGAGDQRVRYAAERALVVIHAARKGKFVPVAKGVGFGPRASDDFEAAPEGAKLAGASDVGRVIAATAEMLGQSLSNATTAVLGKMASETEYEQVNDTEDQARVDVEAILAESNELFNATSTEASTSCSSSTDLGLGLPTSSLCSPVEKRIFSPDPVKPTHRPTTPQIGNPGTSRPAVLSRHASPSFESAAAGARLTPSRMGHVSPRPSRPAALAMVESVSDAAVEKVVERVETPEIAKAVDEILSGETAASEDGMNGTGRLVKQTEVVVVASGGGGGGGDDDDDEDMPEIDMGDSDASGNEDQD
ncbi:uncharacterized protein MEPE_00346 [Melanopsichium pennsylvanicum]|uniref:Pre-rRNA-processing protein RIX1 N-terminal domain-containing protein n=2 Tax=Melanopsichium pennsylvanicum TaxID=63383 RepID=A0AAJ4XH55_9BASI|nr:putative protein [Melanopsichium pennsylvanicum 4]SNX81641.1 uncharacterized protein MEPE_00346 [Melanopsichium pennsylvanicum]